MSDLEEILKGLAAHNLRKRYRHGVYTTSDLDAEVECLRESGLLRLLEAGQAMRKMIDYRNFTLKEEDEWDAAMAAIREAVRR